MKEVYYIYRFERIKKHYVNNINIIVSLIGKKLFIGKDVYDSLNEIIDKYINPCN